MPVPVLVRRRCARVAHPERHRVGDAKVRHVARPQWAEMRVEANLPAAVHLLRLAVQLRQCQLWCDVRVGHGQLELEVKLVSQEIMHVPHLARPPRACFVRLDCEPLVARLLVDLLILRA